MPVNGVALSAGLIGAGLLWSALNNKSLLNTTKDVIKGKQPTPGPQVNAPVFDVSTPAVTTAGKAGGSVTGNEAIGQLMAAAYGWGTGANWAYLRSGWAEESGWSTTAAYDKSDPYNHAYGIPQANPGSKMASAGSDWQTSASTQIKWGLGYIKATYGAPVNVPGWSANGPVAGYVGY
jgi:hypothetical protein